MEPTPKPKVDKETFPEGVSCPDLATIIALYQLSLNSCNVDKEKIKQFFKKEKPAN
jgi:hypothetical protein